MNLMNLQDVFDKQLKIEGHLKILKKGAEYIRRDFKISEVFRDEHIPSQLQSFYIMEDLVEEANDAVSWWRSLSTDQQLSYDR
ncbi:hypothetical protein OI978_20930 [Serratia nevei]|uniref:hypothetical protein n=1 Tax=Serratia nevei TaxID=2703794 RepID=UPI0025429D1F|nr:hypothetical protein [Serratia nevei]EMB4113227.1 hypothetical protein [Serratia marcescens]WIJ63278.1 hypothetical protein OI978_20930 [Serratia nevei]